MNILITGVNGFIGKQVTKYLDTLSSVKVYGIGRFDTYQGNSNIKYIRADITDFTSLQKLKDKIMNCNVLIHIAASINMNFNDHDIIKTNCTGTQNICLLAQILSCEKIIYISSIPVIGKPSILPITENHPQQPESLYHITKLSGEFMINLMKNFGIIPIILRIPSPIGIGMNLRTILPVFIDNALKNNDIVLYGKGMRRQNFIDVRDIAQSILKAIEYNGEGLFNIASEHSISNYELAETCIKLINTKSKICFNGLADPQEDYRWDISIEKAKEKLGYYPEYQLTDTIKWMLSKQ